MKIDKPKLLKAMGETVGIMIVGLIGAAIATLPIILSILTGSFWWLLLYALGFFIISTVEKYREY